MRHATLSLAASAGLCAGAVAGPLDRTMVPADAAMVVHVDLEALIRSELTKVRVHDGQTILDQVRTQISEEMGADLTDDVWGVTLWSADHEQEPIVVVSMSPTAETKLREVAAKEQIAFKRFGSLEIAEIDDGNLVTFVPGRRTGERIAILADSEERIRAASTLVANPGRVVVDVADSPLSRPPRDGSIVYVSAAKMAEALKFEAVSLILSRTEGALVDMGESNGRLFMDVSVTAPDEQEAQALNQMLAGAVGMAQFLAIQNPELKPLSKLAQGMRFNVDNTLISISFDADTQTVIDALQAVQETMENEGFDMGDVHDRAIDRRKEVREERRGEEL